MRPLRRLSRPFSPFRRGRKKAGYAVFRFGLKKYEGAGTVRGDLKALDLSFESALVNDLESRLSLPVGDAHRQAAYGRDAADLFDLSPVDEGESV